jgi:hypothetical protein
MSVCVFVCVVLTPAVQVNMGLSLLSAVAVFWLIPVFQPLFIEAGLYGIDMSKIGKQKVCMCSVY